MGPMPMNARDGNRVSTAVAYLPVGETPPNLTIRADTHVANVVFEGRRAAGVRLVGRVDFRLDPSVNLLMSNRPFGQFDRLVSFGPPVFL